METSLTLIETLALTLCVAAATTVLFRRLKQPALLGYILAGVIVSPHTPIPLWVHLPTVEALSQIGIVVLVFSIGLEFDLRKLFAIGPSAGLVAALEIGAMLWLGFLVGRLSGLGVQQSVFVGGVIAISSTSIAAKTLAEERVEKRVTELAFGITVVEDLLGILLLALLSAVAAGAGLSAVEFAAVGLRLALVLLAMVALGLLVVPRFRSYVVSLGSRETTVVAAIGVCFAFALIAHAAGYSVALGAFIGGMLASESGQARRIEGLVRPVRDVFVAIFFVSVGMLVDPRLVAEHWGTILVLTAAVIVGKVVAISVGAVLIGNRIETAVRVGMSLTAVGELSFLFAAVAQPLGPSMEFLQPVAAAVVVLTSFLTPLLVRRSTALSMWIAESAPKPVRTFLALYGDWVGSLGRASGPRTRAGRMRGLVGWILIDAALLLTLVALAALGQDRLVRFAEETTGLSRQLLVPLLGAAAAVAALPFLAGLLRCIRRLGLLIALEALPAVAPGQLDLAQAPRRALTTGVQVALLLVVFVPLLAAAQPFLPTLPSVGVLLAIVGLAVVLFWRSASNLEGHVRAGTSVIAEVLGRQRREAAPPTLEMVSSLLPGLGKLLPVRLEPEHGAVERTLQELNVHGHTGAAVLCVTREDAVLQVQGDLRLRAGDIVTLAGSEEAVSAAREHLAAAPAPRT